MKRYSEEGWSTTLNVATQRQKIGFLWLLFSVFMMILWVYPCNAQPIAPTFDNAVRIGTTVPKTDSILLGDFNNDGFLDIVQGNIDAQSYVYLNDRHGIFNISFPIGNANQTHSIAVGDLNGDGFLDIVQASLQQPSYIYLNNRQGGFTKPIPFGSDHDNSRSVAVGDLNGDGFLDIVQGNHGKSYIYLNDRQGGFTTSIPFGHQQDNTWTVVVGDLNGDGFLDIVQGNYGQSYVYFNKGRKTFITGDEGFMTTKLFNENDNTDSIALGDLNNDGLLDIIRTSSNLMLESSASSVNQQIAEGVQAAMRIFQPSSIHSSSIYLNDGRGGFLRPTLLGDPQFTRSISVGDLNGDGFLDIVQANSGQSYIYINDGQGNFVSSVPFSHKLDDTRIIAVGDLNGDGFLDIIQGNTNGPSAIYLNKSIGNFTHSIPFSNPLDSTQSIAVGDLNDDGLLDIVQGNYHQLSSVYLNKGRGNFTPAITFSAPTGSESVAVGDLDGDGSLDIVQANYDQLSSVYLNKNLGNFANVSPKYIGNPVINIFSLGIVVGDLNGDGFLDIVQANLQQSNYIYLNDRQGGFTKPIPFGSELNNTRSVVLGDLNGDGFLDIVQANNGTQSYIYLNDGYGNFDNSRRVYFGSAFDNPHSVAVGDFNGDGFLDIVQANSGTQSHIYLNNGHSSFSQSIPFGGTFDNTWSVAVGDLNGDGFLDIVQANDEQSSYVYLNDGHGNFANTIPFGHTFDTTRSVALGDLNGDGFLDIIQANDGQQSYVYLNDLRSAAGLANNGALIRVTRPIITHDANFFSSPILLISQTLPITYTLFDPEGDKVGQVAAFYSQDGGGMWRPAVTTQSTITQTQNLTTGQWIVGASFVTNTITTSTPLTVPLFITPSMPISQVEVWLTITDTDNANLALLLQSPTGTRVPLIKAKQTQGQSFQNIHFSSLALTSVLSGTVPYTGTYQPIGNLANLIGETSKGVWKLIIHYQGIQDKGVLVAWGLRIKTAPAPHRFTWDTFASGFFGQSDNVVIRMVAYAQPLMATMSVTGTYRYTNNVAGPYQWPFASATTFPFRVRGTQVQVYSNTITTTAVVSNAIVYRLPSTVTRGAQPLGDASGQPFVTDAHGYLQGRGEIAKGDRLIALLPITHTTNYTLYYTSATPTVTGLDMFTVTQPGIQSMIITAHHPFLLFNLTVALEWDARNDEAYQNQLRVYLQRASELLYTWTNGQAALGDITIYDNRQHWNDANIRILASNRLRPNSDQGGIVASTLTETVPISRNDVMTTTTLVYQSGQVHMPVLWNRFGAADSRSLGEDWPRTLAHELGHYLFFLFDNYLGFNAAGKFVPVPKADCPGVMSDPYREDHYVLQVGWPNRPDCNNTFSNRIAQRADWATIADHYPVITPTMPYTGPNTLPLAVTHIAFTMPSTQAPSTTIAVPIYSLVDQAQKPYYPSGQARAFLFAADRLIDLGQPIGDQIKAWGASSGHRLCLFDPARQYNGCKTLTTSDNELPLQQQKDWQPSVIVRPMTAGTIQISITNPINTFALHARLYPVHAISATTSITLTPAASGYIGEFTNVPTNTYEAYLHIWVGDHLTDASLQAVTDFAIGGNPGTNDPMPSGFYGCYNPISGKLCTPVLSSDGQAMLLGPTFHLDHGQFYAIQTVSQIPANPAWTTVVGQAYRLLTFPTTNTLTNATLSLSYLPGELPSGEKLKLYRYNEDPKINAWQPLTTTRQLTEVNSTVASITQPGLYVLMSSLEVSLAGRGWNLIGFPVQESRPVTVALRSINGQYQTVYSYDATDPNNPWKIYDRNLPSAFNDLTRLDFGQGYWVNITDTLNTTPTLQLKGTSSLTTTQQTQRVAAAFSLLYPPPATYYGELEASVDFTGTMPITATIDGIICGTARIQEAKGKLMYLIKVSAAIPGDAQKIHCGAPDRIVTFLGITHEPVTRPWDNSQVHILKPEQ